MGRSLEAADRDQASFLPARLQQYIDPDNPVRVIDAFVDDLDLVQLGFGRVQPASAADPAAPRARCSSYMSMTI